MICIFVDVVKSTFKYAYYNLNKYTKIRFQKYLIGREKIAKVHTFCTHCIYINISLYILRRSKRQAVPQRKAVFDMDPVF